MQQQLGQAAQVFDVLCGLTKLRWSAVVDALEELQGSDLIALPCDVPTEPMNVEKEQNDPNLDDQEVKLNPIELCLDDRWDRFDDSVEGYGLRVLGHRGCEVQLNDSSCDGIRGCTRYQFLYR